jgi:hypothetical protein
MNTELDRLLKAKCRRVATTSYRLMLKDMCPSVHDLPRPWEATESNSRLSKSLKRNPLASKPHRCGTVHKARFSKQVAGELPRAITYWHPASFRLPGMTKADTHLAIQTIFRLAQLYVPVPFDKVARENKALIRITLGDRRDFDREGNTLAMADVLSLRDPEPRGIWFSPFVNWGEGPVTDAAINPIPVGAHELAHCLGFGHNPNLGLMSPTINALITTPTEQEMQVFWTEYSEWSPTQEV